MTAVEGPPISLQGRDLLSAADLTRPEVEQLFSTAWALKDEYRSTRRHARPALSGRTIAMLFQRPSLRTHMEDVLRTLRESLPEARGSFLTSSEGLPLAVSKTDDGKDVDALSAMVCGGVLRNLDMVGGNLGLEEQDGGLVRFHKGALLYRTLPDVGKLVVVLDRDASAGQDLREVDVAARELQSLVRES